jgi:hypothetical protein
MHCCELSVVSLLLLLQLSIKLQLRLQLGVSSMDGQCRRY